MYIPPHFKVTDLHWLDWLAAHDSFGTLISTVDGAPFATHLPVLYRRDGDQVTLTGHWARPNQQWRSIETQRVLFIFHGPHTYVSPRWYTAPQRNVPTWNYATAHLYGRVKLVQEPAALEQIVSRLADQFEKGAQSPWRFADSNGSQLLRGIVGFELVAEQMEVKFKLNQNHPRQNIDGVIAGLSQVPGDDPRTVVELMRSTLTDKPKDS
jgi:transcriptional regulator